MKRQQAKLATSRIVNNILESECLIQVKLVIEGNLSIHRLICVGVGFELEAFYIYLQTETAWSVFETFFEAKTATV